MALQNIGAGNRDDAFYRYKMPRLVTKIEGRGNGIKTNVVNMVEVAKALARHPSYTTKYFGCELGAQSKFDEKTGTSIVNGAHETAKLAALLENFIKKYVQCYGCGNPETEVVITKTQMITLKCAACGFVSDVDMRDKLTTFILKNPPEQKKIGKKDKQHMRRAEKERLKEGEAVDEEMKKVKKDSRKKKAGEDDNKKQLLVKKKGGSDDEESLLSPSSSQVDEEEENGGEKEEDDDDGVEWQTDTSAEAAKRRITEQLTAATSEMVLLEEDDGGKAAEESSKPKMPLKESTKSKLLLKKTSSKKTDAAVENDVKIVEELPLHEKLLKDIKGCLEKGFTSAQLAAYLQSKEEPRTEVMNAYFEALFGGLTKGLSNEVGKKKQYLKVVVQDEDSQAKLLGAIEAFCSSLPANAGKEIAMLLKVLYDSDILEEEQILLWFDAAQQVASNGVTPPKLKALQVRKFAQPFVDWLRSAEAESEEEDDE
jgi:translation initiation factor 5